MLCTFLGIRHPVRFLPPPPPPHPNMGWCDGRDSASPPYLTDQQQQQGPSLRVTQALELYRACVAAGQWVRFSVEQRVEGEFISFVSKPPAAAATAAAAATRKRKKMNKRRAKRQRKWRETQGSSSAAAKAQQQPLPAGSQQQSRNVVKVKKSSVKFWVLHENCSFRSLSTFYFEDFAPVLFLSNSK